MSFEKRHEVVISGMAGIYPESDDVDELWRRLLNKEDMVTTDGRRWLPGEFDVPAGTGKVKSPEKFDMAFFGIHRKLCEKMDPYTRLQCEQAYRAICDAGVNPRSLEGSNTAVIMGSFSTEPEHDLGASITNQGIYNCLGFSRTMQANRLSYFLNLKGPSFQLDCSWCGGIQTIQHACDLISSGMCTAAIVGTCHLINKPEPSLAYHVMGRLSEDSVTRSFSADADGYARSECCVTMFLQRKEDANRIYGTVVAAKVFNYGSKDQAFTEFPSGRYDQFLIDTYKNANVDPKDLAYVEAYGAASKTLDALELNALSRTLLKDRTEPLLIGSIKTNIGHTEGSSAMASLTKVLLMLDRGVIPPNLSYSAPNPDVPELVSGKLQVVMEPTPLQGDTVGLCELSLTGICGHIIMKRCEKVKALKEETEDESSDIPKRLPFLVMMSGRSEDVLSKNMKSIESSNVDEEFAILLNSLYKEGIKPHVYRGYTVISDTPNSYNMVGPAPSGEKRPVWFMYSGMGSQWPMMAKALMDLPIFSQAIHNCHDVLAPKGVNLIDIVTKDDASLFDVILNSFVGIAAVQIGLTDVLRAIGVTPDGIIGHSVGELGCAYADGCMTAEQMILSAYARGRASVEADLVKGMMAAVGIGYNAIKDKLPSSIEVACHNSKDSCTLSGPTQDMTPYIAQLKSKGMFAKLVNVANIAYHSRYIKPAAPALLKYLKEIIPVPSKRSPKWVSSSNLEVNWDTELAQYSSAEYHTNNLLSSVLFEEASAHIPSNAIVIEIAPHGLLQAIVRKSIPHAVHIPLTSRFDPNNLMHLLGAVGKMYLAGIPVDLKALYPTAKFPVGRGTPAISPLIDWLREENFIIRRSINDSDSPSPNCRFISIKKGDHEFEKLTANKINKRVILPHNFYYNNIIDMFTNIGNNDDMPLILEEFKFTGHAEVSINSTTEIRCQLLQGTGNVVINNCNDNAIIVQGKINIIDIASVNDLNTPGVVPPQSGSISRREMVKYMKSMGAEKYEPGIQVDEIFLRNDDAIATAKWTGELGDFLASALSLVEFHETWKYNVLKLIYKVGEMRINRPLLSGSVQKELLIHYDATNKSLQCEGVKISFIGCKNPGLDRAIDKKYFLAFELPNFVPYINNDSISFKDLVIISTQLILENTVVTHDTAIKIMEIGQNEELRIALEGVVNSMKYSGHTQMTSFDTEQEFAKQGSSVLHQKDVFVVFAEQPSEEVLKSLAIINNGFVLMLKSQSEQLVKNHSKIVFESIVNGLWYSLISVGNKSFKRQFEAVNLNDSCYLDNLEYQLTKAGEMKLVDESQPIKSINLWGEVDSMVTVDKIVEETKNLPYNHLLYYWFFYGSSPDFNSGDFDFQNQIQRDVKMNISKGGIWGSLRLLPADVNEEHEDTTRPTKFYYPLSAVMTSHNIQALGLSLKDCLSVGASPELGVYDYVNSKVMGIGIYDHDAKIFKPDNILSWPKPTKWSSEEAATIPVLYSLASYILHHINNIEWINDRTILVNRALLPLSQAIISLALYENMTVYTSVYGEHEKQMLLERFPRLPERNIYDCSTVAFFVDLIRDANKVYKVINSFDDTRMIEPCLRCVKPLGTLIYLSESLTSEAYMGMRMFDYEILAKGASRNILLKSSDEVKICIKKHLHGALSKGVVTPLRSVTTLSPSTLHIDAAKTLEMVSDKVIVGNEDSTIAKEKKIYLKDESKRKIIVEGQIQTDVTLDILEWLLKRGSRKVVVFMRHIHPHEATSLKLQSLRAQYRCAEIDVRSSNDQLSSKIDIKKFVEECPSQGLEMGFFLGSGLRDKIEQFDEMLSTKMPNFKLICIGKGGENNSERRQKNALPALYIRCSTSSLEYMDLCQHLDRLIKDSSKVPEVLVNKYMIHTRTLQGLVADLKHIPDSRTELQDLLKQCTPRATFVEILTASPTKKFNRELYPLFLIPGLRPKRLHRLASQLHGPAFEAKLPSAKGVTSIDRMADDLVQQLVSLPQNLFTLVADDWGGILALHVAAKLESLSKLATVILLRATPASTRKWANGLLNDDVVLIRKYLTVSSEVKFSAKSSSWEETLKLAIESSDLKNHEDRILIKDGLNLLRNRLKDIVRSRPPSNKIKTKCHVVEIPDQAFEEHGLNDYLQKDPILHIKEVESVEEMIDTAVADDVNSLLMFEYKDAANPPIEEYIGMHVVKKPTWMSSSLYRVTQ